MPQINRSYTLTKEELERLKEIRDMDKQRSLSATVGLLINQGYEQRKQLRKDAEVLNL